VPDERSGQHQGNQHSLALNAVIDDRARYPVARYLDTRGERFVIATAEDSWLRAANRAVRDQRAPDSPTEMTRGEMDTHEPRRRHVHAAKATFHKVFPAKGLS
jgi:hypothetical protein